jgi:hypothetical protein
MTSDSLRDSYDRAFSANLERENWTSGATYRMPF